MVNLTTDTLLLSAACPLKRQKHMASVLDVGCGDGALGALMRLRNDNFCYTGVDINPELISAAKADGNFKFVEADFLNWYQKDFYNSFDHLISNPPYFLRPNGRVSPNTLRETARGISLEDAARWIDYCWKYLKPLGWFSLIWPANLLSDLMTFVDGKASHLILLPVQTAAEKSPIRFIVLMRKPAKKIQQAEVDYLHPIKFWGEERAELEDCILNKQTNLWTYLKQKDLNLPQVLPSC